MTKCLHNQPKATAKITSYVMTAVDRWLERGFKPKTVKNINGSTYVYGVHNGKPGFLKFLLNPRKDGVFTHESRTYAHLLNLVGGNTSQAYLEGCA